MFPHNLHPFSATVTSKKEWKYVLQFGIYMYYFSIAFFEILHYFIDLDVQLMPWTFCEGVIYIRTFFTSLSV